MLGLGIGVSQGLADRSRQRLVYGVIGGGLGGLVGGYLFEWLRQGLGKRYDLEPGARHRHPGRGAGPVPRPGRAGPAPGLGPGAPRPPGRAQRTCWRGRRSALGLDERAEVGLFGDPTVARRHADDRVDARRATPARLRTEPGGPRSTARSSATRRRSTMAIGSSWGRRCWCFGNGRANRHGGGRRER